MSKNMSETLSNRDNWQIEANATGSEGEVAFDDALASALPEHFIIESQPKLNIYGGKGIVLDSKVINSKTNTSVFIETKTGNNGGNAHERVYKYASPAMKRAIIDYVKNDGDNITDVPVVMVFQGETFTGDKSDKYVKELATILADDVYFVMEPDRSNIAAVADKVVEIIGD